ncbi:MAG: SusC/RagA family TonB-linked outer membrane protein [Gemmatimonadota bacterium]
MKRTMFAGVCLVAMSSAGVGGQTVGDGVTDAGVLDATARPEPEVVGTITGVVRDATSGAPLPSVQVFVEGANIGSLTQANGRYLLQSVPDGTHTITAQRIGYRTESQEVTVQSGATLVVDFQILEQAISLNEIVVTGTAGGAQRRSLGNAVERMNVDAIQEVSASSSVEELLNGRVPGLYMTATGGAVGENAAPVRIRGVSSVGIGNDPIVYVDGVRINSTMRAYGYSQSTSRLNDINPNDIESIQVIKGPAAATLYGTEASNGVIQIITKRGQTGAPVFEGSIEGGVNWFKKPASTLPVGWDRDPVTREIISANLYEVESARIGHDLFQYGPHQRYNLGVSGGTDLIRYYASATYVDEEGFVSWNTNKNFSGRASLTVTASEQLNITMNGSFVTGDTRSANNNIWGTFARSQVSTLDNPSRRGFQEPLEAYEDVEFETYSVDRQTWNLQASYVPADWLKARVSAGTDRGTEGAIDLILREPNAPNGWYRRDGLGDKSIREINTIVNTIDVAATATVGLTEALEGETSVGLQYYDRQVTNYGLNGEEFATSALSTISAAARSTSSETFLQNKTAGVYIQEQLSWKNRVFFTGAVRADDNSAFGQDFDLAIYPKLSAAWVVSEESFWNFDHVNTLRFRGAWGQAGKQPDVFAATRLYGTNTGPGGVPILSPESFGNPDLGPEKGSEIEVGFDATLFDERVSLEVTQFWKSTKDAIISQTVTFSTGFPGSRFINAGEIKNWGTEISASVVAVETDRLRWNFDLAYSHLGSEAVDLGEQDRLLENGTAGIYHVVGYPLGSMWSKQVVSADFRSGNSGAVENAMCDGGTGPNNANPGGAPVPCADAPLIYSGAGGEPTGLVNFSSTLTFNDNLRLYASLDGRWGNKRFDQDLAAGLTSWANREPALRQDNPIFMAQRTVDRVPLARYDGGFIALREVGLQYTVPSEIAGRLGLDRMALKASMRNVGYVWVQQNRAWLTGEKIPSPLCRRFSASLSA